MNKKNLPEYLTIGSLEDLCHYLGHEWGNDCNIYAVIDDYNGNVETVKINDVDYGKDGSLFLLNRDKQDIGKVED